MGVLLVEHQHNESMASVGFGLGQLDYFCEGPDGCGKLFKSVKLEDMNAEEKALVAHLTVNVFDIIDPNLPWTTFGQKGPY